MPSRFGCGRHPSGAADQKRERGGQQGEAEFDAVLVHEEAVDDMHAEDGDQHGEAQDARGGANQETRPEQSPAVPGANGRK